MSPQADYVVANGTGAAVRSDINGQLAAIVSNNSGASAPATTYAYQFWADTSTNLLKLRNGANSAWITVGDLTAANLGLASLASPTFTGTVTIPTLTVSTGANIPLGTAASPTLYFTGDTNTGLYSPGADQLALTTGGTGRLFINSSGSVGIGTSSPSTRLHLNSADASANYLRVENTGGYALFGVDGSGNTYAGAESNDAFGLVTNGSYRMYITAGGNVGIGTTSPSNILDCRFSGEDGINVQSTTSSNANITLKAATATATSWLIQAGSSVSNGLRFYDLTTGSERARIDSSGRLLVGTSSSPSVGDSQYSYLVVQGYPGGATGNANISLQRGETAANITSDEQIGDINFTDSAGYSFAKISCLADANAGTNDYPGRLVFSTTADGASSPTERMKIASNGVMTLGLDGIRFCVFRPSGSFSFRGGDVGDGFIRCEDTSANAKFTVSSAGNGVFAGSLSKGSGSFKISHPLPEKTNTHYLVHSFIEGPQADLIYRGHIGLVDGTAQVNIDKAGRMTEGTFEALCTNVCCFTSNETDWTPVRGHVDGNILTIEAQDPTSTAEVCWMVIGERKDQHMLDTDWTDKDGRVITEPLKDVVTPEAA